MNKQRYVISVFVVFVFVFLYEFLVHGFLLKDIYTQTAHCGVLKKNTRCSSCS